MTDSINNTEKKSNLPTHIVSFVQDYDKAKWTKIGAGWEHGDKKGLTLELDLIPANSDGRIVIRVNEPKPKAEDSTA